MHSSAMQSTWCILPQPMHAVTRACCKQVSSYHPLAKLAYSKSASRSCRLPPHAAKEDTSTHAHSPSSPKSNASLEGQIEEKLLVPSRLAKLRGLIEDQAAGVLQDLQELSLGGLPDARSSGANDVDFSFKYAMQLLTAASEADEIDVPKKFQAEAALLRTNMDSNRVAHIVFEGKALKLRPVFQPSELHSVGSAVIARAGELCGQPQQMPASAAALYTIGTDQPPAKQSSSGKKMAGSRSKKANDPSIKSLKMSHPAQESTSESDELVAMGQDDEDGIIFDSSSAPVLSVAAARHGRRASRQATGKVELPEMAAKAAELARIRALCLPLAPDGVTEIVETGALGSCELHWYHILVNPGQEVKAANTLSQTIKDLGPLKERLSGKYVDRSCQTWIPSKTISHYNPKTDKMGTKSVLWNKEGSVLLQVVIDDDVCSVIQQDVYSARGFAASHYIKCANGVTAEFPVPCTDEELDGIRTWVDADEVVSKAVVAQELGQAAFAAAQQAKQNVSGSIEGEQHLAGYQGSDDLEGTFSNPSGWYEPGSNTAEHPSLDQDEVISGPQNISGRIGASIDEQEHLAAPLARPGNPHEEQPRNAVSAWSNQSSRSVGVVPHATPREADTSWGDTNDEDILTLEEEGDVEGESAGAVTHTGLNHLPRFSRAVDPHRRSGSKHNQPDKRGSSGIAQKEVSPFEAGQATVGTRPSYNAISLEEMLSWSPDIVSRRARAMAGTKAAVAAADVAAEEMSFPPPANFAANPFKSQLPSVANNNVVANNWQQELLRETPVVQRWKRNITGGVGSMPLKRDPDPSVRRRTVKPSAPNHYEREPDVPYESSAFSAIAPLADQQSQLHPQATLSQKHRAEPLDSRSDRRCGVSSWYEPPSASGTSSVAQKSIDWDKLGDNFDGGDETSQEGCNRQYRCQDDEQAP